MNVGEKQYMDAFNDELNGFKDRIRARAQARIDAAMKEYEEVSVPSVFVECVVGQQTYFVLAGQCSLI